jgi:hypothetical protein
VADEWWLMIVDFFLMIYFHVYLFCVIYLLYIWKLKLINIVIECMLLNELHDITEILLKVA